MKRRLLSNANASFWPAQHAHADLAVACKDILEPTQPGSHVMHRRTMVLVEVLVLGEAAAVVTF